MGRDKAQLPLPGGERFLEHAVGLMRELPLAKVMVSGDRPGAVPDPLPGMGPLGGLYGVARSVRADALLAIPVDMPLLRVELLALLLREGERGGRACYFADFHLPLWLPLTAPVRGFLSDAVAGRGPNSIGALSRCAGARRLAVSACAQSFSNINTPAEYAAYYPQKRFLESN